MKRKIVGAFKPLALSLFLYFPSMSYLVLFVTSLSMFLFVTMSNLYTKCLFTHFFTIQLLFVLGVLPRCDFHYEDYFLYSYNGWLYCTTLYHRDRNTKGFLFLSVSETTS